MKNCMREYRVTWEIDLTANSPKDAARLARDIQLDRDNLATSFEVQEIRPIVEITLHVESQKGENS